MNGIEIEGVSGNTTSLIIEQLSEVPAGAFYTAGDRFRCIFGLRFQMLERVKICSLDNSDLPLLKAATFFV